IGIETERLEGPPRRTRSGLSRSPSPSPSRPRRKGSPRNVCRPTGAGTMSAEGAPSGAGMVGIVVERALHSAETSTAMYSSPAMPTSSAPALRHRRAAKAPSIYFGRATLALHLRAALRLHGAGLPLAESRTPTDADSA